MISREKMSGSVEPGHPPSIEHITQNYVPLKTLILSVSERCGKELANVLRTTENLPNDAARKDQFLRFVVACRQEYVKLYVLCKWAVVSGEISKAIDVANWLHGQVNCFNNVVGALYHLQAGLGPAKSPWADIETALQVLKYGGPLPSPEAKLHLPIPPLDNKEVLRVLRRLDVLIALRLALHEHLPAHYRNYTVGNGRARFNIGNSTLWVELSIADEEVSTQCRFFFVNCDFGGLATVNEILKQKIESVVNEQLATRSLIEVLDWLSMFAAVYKLQLLERQLILAETMAGPWAGLISLMCSPSSLNIRYFLDATDPGEAKIMISPKAPHPLIVDPPLDVDLDGPIENLALQVLSKATKTHAARLLSTVNAPWMSKISDFGISVELCPGKFTELTIDTISGKYSLSGSGPLISAAQQNLNKGQYPFIVLSRLRTQVLMDTITTRASAVGWRAMKNVRLAPDEYVKIAPHTSLLALRLSNTSGWSLCVAMGSNTDSPNSTPNSTLNSTRWFATRLECAQRRWIIGPIHDAHCNSLRLDDPDYSTFVELMSVYSKQFILFELMRELNLKNIRHAIKQQNGNNIGVVADITTILMGSSKWAQSGLMCTVEDGNIKMEGRGQPGRLVALGNINETINNAEINIVGSEGKFSVTTKSELGMNSSESTGCGNNLKLLIEALGTLHSAAKSLASATALNLEVRGATLTSLEIKYAEPRGILSVKNGHSITFGETNPQKPLAAFLPAVGEHSKASFGKVVTFLRKWYPIWELIAKLKSERPETDAVILPQTMNWLRVQSGYFNDAPYLEISLRDFRRQKFVNYVSAGNGADNVDEIAKWFKEDRANGVVPLVTGCAVDIGSEHVIAEMVAALSSYSASKG